MSIEKRSFEELENEEMNPLAQAIHEKKYGKSMKEEEDEMDDEEDDEDEDEMKEQKKSVKESSIKTKSSMVKQLFDRVNEMSKDEFEDKFGHLMNIAEAEMEVDDIDMGDASADNPMGRIKKSKKKVMVPEINVKEDIDALVQGEELSEDFRMKASTIFEAAVHQKVMEIANDKIEELEEEYQSQLDEEVSQFRDELTNKVDNYLNYVVEEWMKENEIALESSLRAEITEEFMNGLRNLFTENYIEVPEDRVDIVESLFEKVEELEGKLNNSIQENVQIKSELHSYRRQSILEDVCDDLADTQVEKLKSLVEGINVSDDEEEFESRVKMIKESYFPNRLTNQDEVIEEDFDNLDEEIYHPQTNRIMEAYSKAISRK